MTKTGLSDLTVIYSFWISCINSKSGRADSGTPLSGQPKN